MEDSLVGLRVKVVYSDGDQEKVLRGVLLSEDEHTLTVKGERDGVPFIVGKRALVSCRAEG